MRITHYYTCLILSSVLCGCTASLPDSARAVNNAPKISPDYNKIDIPVNIAPLNFAIDEKGDKYISHFYTRDGSSLTVPGKVMDIDIDSWHDLLNKAQGDTLYADVYVHDPGGWRKHAPLRYYIAEEIDPYVSYRHIEPLYMNYDVQRICQRSLQDFTIEDIYNNSAFLDVEGERQCINCHSYQDYNRGGNMQMHVRVNHGGTLIVKDGNVSKVNLKVGTAFAPGQYPSWHPSLPLIAYSYNDTWQHFHSVNSNKVEVQDGASGMMLYNTDTNEMSIISDSPSELETFPYWSPDGKRLYYVSAKVPLMTPKEMANYRISNYKDIKYNIYRLDFDAASMSFSKPDTLFNAAALGMSATFPRESPDGRFLVFTMGEYGTFHNFHHDADLYIMDLSDGNVTPLDALNSDDTESYHSFSSNGRWLIFSSRRDNGNYTRLYIAHFDENGHAGKPFILPEHSPFTNDMMFRSYNVPEFMVKPVEVSRKEWLEGVQTDAKDAKFVKR